MKRSRASVAAAVLFSTLSPLSSQQLAIPRIEQMPDIPSPYTMRNWRSVVLAYDSLVFRESASGLHLPLVSVSSNGINYPASPAFKLKTYVGSTASLGEAINCLPALVGASLAGHDMRTFYGRDWVAMSLDWFNNRPAEYVYLNGPSSSSGNDWWYETMPNVYFYQMADLYPRTLEVDRQFGLVADRWLAALRTMGGSSAPWQLPAINHRAWKLSTMTPGDAGVPEPEAAGAIGWIMYRAYVSTGQPRYRIGAEWAIEALNALSTNPAYEVQLSYGVQTAARMNAELGTNYDLAKLLNWCFDVGPLRSWGAIVGTWGGIDCSGLIGEVNGTNDYAFAMNTFQQVSALAPVARYDERFARALGKWILNAANASRFFYSASLSDSLEDNELWSSQYDSLSVIAYEGLRQSIQGAGPYATGDAVAGGWAATNLSLYSSSSAGYLAAVVETTDIKGILRIDLLKTDSYRAPAFPTFLMYNPDTVAHSVTLNIGDSLANVYDLISNTTVASVVSGNVSIPIPSDEAVVVVAFPAGASITYSVGRMLANGVVVDFHSAVPAGNRAPRLKALGTARDTVVTSQTIELFCTATDADGDTIDFAWSASSGSILGAGPSAVWQASPIIGTSTIRCVLTDGRGGATEDSLVITILERINRLPSITSVRGQTRRLAPGGATVVTCTASDPDGDTLSYTWSASTGAILGTGTSVTWTAPGASVNAYVKCTVSDGFGGEDAESTSVMVRVSTITSGELIGFYLCDGNGLDASGYNRTGTVASVTTTTDGFGRPGRALLFNGSTSSIRIPSDAVLNSTNAITVTFWMKVGSFPAREQYPISHGNWTDRWKVSISNHRVRWTIKTASGVRDLDSESLLSVDSLVHVAVRYDGTDMEIYLNGRLDAFTSWTGAILTTPIDLMIGQALPTDYAYGFVGMIDDVRLYNFALSPDSISSIMSIVTGISEPKEVVPTRNSLDANVPNPFNPSTTITFHLAFEDDIVMTVVDLLGRTVATLEQGRHSAGSHIVRWDATGFRSGVYVVRLHTSSGDFSHKMLLLR